MIWWARSRFLLLTGLSVLSSAGLAIIAGGAAVPLPSLVAVMFVPVALSYLAPILPVVFFCYGLSRAQTPLERTAVRSIAGFDLGSAALFIAATTVLVVMTSAAGVWPLGGGFLRNFVGCVGLCLLAAPVVGVRYAGLLPVAVILITALFGTSADGSALWWAWPVAESTSPIAAGAAAIILLLGATAYASAARCEPILNF
jgi:hypothetical protein